MQVTGIHAEAYASSEFRHGPLSLIDDKERTPVIFLAFADENLSQVIANIGQVKDRGATVFVITNAKEKLI